MPQDRQLTITDDEHDTTGIGAVTELDAAITVAAEFNGHIDAALAEARSLFSHVITEGSSQQVRIHGERSARSAPIETARNLDIPLCYTELGYLTPEGYGPLPGGFAWASGTTLQEQSEWLRDAVSLAGEDSRIILVIIWNVDFDQYDNDPQAGYAIIRQDGSCPACDAIATLRE